MKSIPFLFLIAVSLQACNSSTEKNSTVKMDTVPLYDLQGNKVRDTLIRSQASSAPKMDTVPIYDLKGNKVRDTLIRRTH